MSLTRIGRQELADQAALPLVSHGLAGDATGRGQREVGDLAPQFGDGALLLGVDLARRTLAQPFGLLARRAKVGVTVLLRDFWARRDVVRLLAGLGEGGDALRLCVLAVLSGLLGILESPARSTRVDPRASWRRA